MKIGERIKYVRESKGLTQVELAQALHISPSFMNRLEKGSSKPSLDYICSIAHALNVPPQNLLCDLFEYPEEQTTVEKIKNLVEQFPPDKQLLILDTGNCQDSCQ